MSDGEVDLLDNEEAAEYLKISPSTLRNWVHRRKIPFVKIGSNVRFIKEDLTKWVRQNRVQEASIFRKQGR